MTPRIRIMLYFQLLVLVVFTSSARPQFPPIIDLADTTADITIFGASDADLAGYSFATGDINGDGLQDLIISSLNGVQENGEFNIIWGAALMSSGTIDLADMSDDVSRISGKDDDDALFCDLSTGDFNNDGYDDILIGEPFGRSPFCEGMAYVIFGSAEFPDTLDLATYPQNVVTIYGGPLYSGGMLGTELCACDLNGDDYDEIVVSAPALPYAEVYIIYGADSLP
ncbi:MAG: hypothetical protein GTO51_02255, partial [Candidatus Latescibacteria bacterium]|nr:hypothetical protein [Candidatus Latescibacterota bacterium]NIM22436.1 hypothetical protein [Candidatus Latescibacterota bacterium]NIM64796.1 hypothetical protein [Candidatus Latescibacterota bacterium]NIO01307.1 hypothetical protein [Candidatus Latescibacterota bacterium]NIO27799.1 hypothetical protein [Candidatus Latescibacterota bacterium]